MAFLKCKELFHKNHDIANRTTCHYSFWKKKRAEKKITNFPQQNLEFLLKSLALNP
jgi:hypothetical protein